MATKNSPAIFQLNVTIQDIRPRIWRCIQVPSQMRLPELHRVLQIVMRWEDCHLHQFRSGNKVYAEPDPEDHYFGRDVADERRVRLPTLLPAIGSSCEYIYDFGDNWRHDIMLEAILKVTPNKRYPVCVTGARSAPPEDVGGVRAYQHYLEALSDREHESHKERLAWRGRFDPERFPITSVNRALRDVFRVRSGTVKKPLVSPVPPKAQFEEILRSLVGSGRLPETKRVQVQPDEQIPIPFSARDRELIVEHSLADTDLTERLRLDLDTGKSQIFYFTLGELDDLIGFIAAEANHADKKARKEWDVLYDRIALVLDGYSESE